jgi:hypothetical protein
MTLIAGWLYLPANWDSNSYRTPRVLHWLGAGEWHWIRTADMRMNVVNCGFEWLTAPLILFTRTDRFLFLINWVSYLMLPGLIFSVFQRLGVRPRAAWWWMWFLASGWCFVMQASSTENDGFAVIYALAAVDLALRAREKKQAADLWLAILATALLTGSKQTNIPLALPCFLAILPGARLLLARPGRTVMVGLFGLIISFLPLAFVNFEHYGQLFPDRFVRPNAGQFHYHLDSPFWGIVGNVFCLPLQNLLPPIFPFSGSWNRLMQEFVDTPLGSHFASFEKFGHLSPGISENTAGIGLGICVLVLASVAGAFAYRRSSFAGGFSGDEEFDWRSGLLRLSPWISLLFFMAKVGMAQNARQLSTYYVFLFPLLLAGRGHVCLARQRWWQRLGLLAMLSSVFVVAADHNHPLFPAETVIGWLKARCPDSQLVSRAWLYISQPSVNSRRNYFDRALPSDETVIGYAAVADAAEPGLWLPWKKHQVERVLFDDSPQQLRSRGIHYVVVESSFLSILRKTPDQWLARYDGVLVDQTTYALELGAQPAQLYLVRLSPDSGLEKKTSRPLSKKQSGK